MECPPELVAMGGDPSLPDVDKTCGLLGASPCSSPRGFVGRRAALSVAVRVCQSLRGFVSRCAALLVATRLSVAACLRITTTRGRRGSRVAVRRQLGGLTLQRKLALG